MSRRVVVTSVAAVAAIAIVAVYAVVDPATSVWMPKCIFKMVTGYDCPGCGSQRMLHSLLHGDIAGAWKANSFLLLLLPVLAGMLFAEIFKDKYPGIFKFFFSTATCVVICVAIIAWFVIRNFC